MRRTWIALLGCSGLAAAHLLPVPDGATDRSEPGRLLRRAMRPLVLPRLWRSVDEAHRSGHPLESLALARQLMDLLPDWRDGHLHFAWRLAVDLAQPGETTDGGLDRLLLATAWLEESAARLARKSPADAAEILTTAALLVESRSMRDPAMALRYRERFGAPLMDAAEDFVRRAAVLDPLRSRQERRAFLAARLVAGALQLDDLELARSRAREAIDLLQGSEATGADAWAAGLADFLAHPEDPQAMERLRGNPLMAEIAAAMEER